MIKDRDEQPYEKIQSRRVSSAGASVSVQLGCTTLLACRCVHQARSYMNPIFGGF